MPKESHAAPRQRPVSCKLCRTRKLRCSREAPCSNCVSRGISCELEAYTTPRPAIPSTIPEQANLMERIRKLEETVRQQQSQLLLNQRPDVGTQQVQQSPNQNLNNDRDHQMHQDSLSSSVGLNNTPSESLGVSTPATQPHVIPHLLPNQPLDSDVAWLESIYNGHEFSVS